MQPFVVVVVVVVVRPKLMLLLVVANRKYTALSKLMSEDHNWSDYRIELQTKLDDYIPCIPFLGVLLTTIVQQGSVNTVKMRGRRFSGVEDYTIMEAITVRNR